MERNGAQSEATESASGLFGAGNKPFERGMDSRHAGLSQMSSSRKGIWWECIQADASQKACMGL
jgi:hypothetical protein